MAAPVAVPIVKFNKMLVFARVELGDVAAGVKTLEVFVSESLESYARR